VSKSWAFLVVDDSERNHMGNAGYQDVVGKHYTWDDRVANGRHVEEGDFVVLRDGKWLLGVAWIDSIESWPDTKDRYRCPECGDTKFRQRTKQATRFRCRKCGNEFDEPNVEPLEVIFSRAEYERTWQEFDTAVPDSVLEPAFVAGARQNSIRELKFDEVKGIIEQAQNLGIWWWQSSSETQMKLPGGHYPILGKARVGQQRFREEMLKRFEGACAICGPLPGAMLDAAHIYRYSDEGEHYVDGGLLLRRDLHALFDRWEILIDPDDGWRVWVHPEHTKYDEVWRFNGQELRAKPAARPAAEYLRIHATIAREKWQN
jgi:ribosomal protein L37AE/L43A